MGGNSNLKNQVHSHILTRLGNGKPGMELVRIIVADDQKVVQEGIRRILDSSDEFEIVGEAYDGATAIELAVDLKPDILVSEVSIPVINGIDAAAQVKEQCPGTKILFFTMYGDKEYVRRALKIGASGYILKDDTNSDFLEAVKVVSSGATYFSWGFVKTLREYLEELETNAGCNDPYERLSRREREVFRLLAEGKSVRQIGELLCISPKTVETHKYNIMQKMEMATLSDLIRYAIRKKIIKL